MGERLQEQRLSEVLKAVSDATRRSILTTLVQEGPLRVTELAGRYDMSLNAISKHIKVLEAVNLVTRRTIGRVHLIEADLDPVRAVDAWFGQLRSIWDLRLERLGEVIAKGVTRDERPVPDGNKDDPGPG
jgi:DNA-binding transcriptional ArsR family regulator